MREIDPRDPKGLIRESYRIPGITVAECRTIFLDWALSAPGNAKDVIQHLLMDHGAQAPDHPMTQTLTAALAEQPVARRRGGRSGRLAG
ncbi:MAG: hypothetical protein AAFP98_12395 [Pseudomonadota bacterium]